MYKAVHRGGVEFLVTNPYGEDTRPQEERMKFMDMRKPATKRQLLFEIFKAIDTSGDGKIDRVELLTALRSDNSLVRARFPTHINELSSWIDASSTSDKLTFDHFHEIASQALSCTLKLLPHSPSLPRSRSLTVCVRRLLTVPGGR